MKPLSFFQIDAFTDQVFGGNPAAVVPLDQWPEDALLQNMATEHNLSETAYLVPKDDGYHIRWFTPVAEVDLCGHATLASAHYLFAIAAYERDTIRFHSRSGELLVRRTEQGYQLDFPLDVIRPVEVDPIWSSIVGAEVKEAYQGKTDLLFITGDAGQVYDCKPDMAAITKLGGRGIILSARDTSGRYDIISRCFYPAFGVPEDPVTGSAHTTLLAYWDQELHQTEYKAFQASTRGGHIICCRKNDRALLTGKAVTYATGMIWIPN
ncbi:MAG: PhzF family phenazine biosynthesis protein [Saprospiraceae bacterium]|nr:PhzF family phenazine biosynthesis protein [Saprospiraceae bacterium]MCB9318889.1 PhzF family phenazine biosynthesis protein [Lewinellaceae bacterium]